MQFVTQVLITSENSSISEIQTEKDGAKDLPKLQPIFTGTFHCNVQILKRLSDDDLKDVFRVSRSFHEFKQNNLLWDAKIKYRFGKAVFQLKAFESSSFQIYSQLIRIPLTVGGANLALVRNSKASLNWLKMQGIEPNIENSLPNQTVRMFRIDEEFLKFCQEIDLGPQIAGTFSFLHPNSYLAKKVDRGSLFPLAGTSLKDLLYFMHPQINGAPNPFYGLVTQDLVISLFSLHAKITRMKPMFNHKNFTASSQMRKYLAKSMSQTIDEKIKRLMDYLVKQKEATVEKIAEIHKIQKQLHITVLDPNLDIDSSSLPNDSRLRIFNPNNFTYIGFVSLINSLQVGRKLNSNEMEELQLKLPSVYPHLSSINCNVEKFFFLQINLIRLAKNYYEMTHRVGRKLLKF